MIRLSLTFPLSWYIPLLSCSCQRLYKKLSKQFIGLGQTLSMVLHLGHGSHLPVMSEPIFNKGLLPLPWPPKRHEQNQTVFSRRLLFHLGQIDWAQAVFHFFFQWKHFFLYFFRKTFPYCHPRNVNLETWMQRCWLCSWGLNWSLAVNFDLAPSLAATAWSTVPVSVLWFQDCFLVILWVHGFFLACTQLTV